MSDPRTNGQWRAEVKKRDHRIKEVEDRLKKVLRLCEQYETNCDPTSTQAQVAELFRQAAED